jgi:hypothetical protein
MVRSIRERERVGPAIKAVLIRRVFTSYGEEDGKIWRKRERREVAFLPITGRVAEIKLTYTVSQ